MQTQLYIGVSNRTGGDVSGLYRRPTDGAAWSLCELPPGTHVHAITVDPHDPAVVYAAASSGLYRSRDRGDTWRRLIEPQGQEQFWSVLIHPSNPATILAGTAPLGLHRSDDNGETWRCMPRPAIAERMVGAFPSRIMRMAVAPSRPETIWAGMEVNGAMRSDDGGETWLDLSDELVALAKLPHLESAILTKDTAEGMLDVHAICVSPVAPGLALPGAAHGPVSREDRGSSLDRPEYRPARGASALRAGRGGGAVGPCDAVCLRRTMPRAAMPGDSSKAQDTGAPLVADRPRDRRCQHDDGGFARPEQSAPDSLRDAQGPDVQHRRWRESWRDIPLPEAPGPPWPPPAAHSSCVSGWPCWRRWRCALRPMRSARAGCCASCTSTPRRYEIHRGNQAIRC